MEHPQISLVFRKGFMFSLCTSGYEQDFHKSMKILLGFLPSWTFHFVFVFLVPTQICRVFVKGEAVGSWRVNTPRNSLKNPMAVVCRLFFSDSAHCGSVKDDIYISRAIERGVMKCIFESFWLMPTCCCFDSGNTFMQQKCETNPFIDTSGWKKAALPQYALRLMCHDLMIQQIRRVKIYRFAIIYLFMGVLVDVLCRPWRGGIVIHHPGLKQI